ncbi:acyl-CoA dehydrogenase family protein [Egicoccus sp. AB-alg2]|uniref:acyl-CoA dehydrogenase family protein n=1 Tax=Egicoccus sp. AB-alg2 TaxID=3242693 RepID=UPI00359EA62C
MDGVAVEPDVTAWEDRVAQLRVLARERLAPVATAGPHGRVNRRLVAALAEAGVSPRLFPSSLGGSAADRVAATELCLLREAIAAESPTAETTLAVQGLGSYPILLAGRPELARRWIPEVAGGRAVAAFALTEPDAGSDAAALRLRAERDGDGYRLTGEKVWISHAPDADVYTVFARTTPDAGARGVTAFAVPGDAPGLTGEPLELLAPHAIGRLVFDGVPVTAEQVLGDVDAGFRVAMATLDRFRPSVGAAAVGMAQAALEAACDHAASRRAFGQELRDFQAVSHRLADMATRIQAARLLVRDAARLHDAGARPTRSAAMAKLFATEVAQEVVDGAIQVHGAAGLRRGHLLEELYREVRALRIYEGASEIQRTIIARELFRDR